MDYAIGRAKNDLSSNALERLADALLAEIKLDDQAILAAVGL